MLSDIPSMSLMNITVNDTNSYPLWYFLNDSLIIISNIIGIIMSFLFIFTIYRLDHPDYSISNLIACNTCLAIGLTSIIMFIDGCYALTSDFRGIGYLDSTCIIRGILLKLFNIYMYISLCLKAFNRLRCIVYYTNPILKSYGTLLIIILSFWLISIVSILIIVLTDGIHYDWGSHLCLIPLTKTSQFTFLMFIYYISILFISGVYIYILNYVLHLSLLERYRRKRQFALVRRILILLIMIMIPGVFSTFLLIRWIIVGSIPLYSFKIRTLLDTIGHTGSVMTIFISHTKIRRQYYNRKISKRKKLFRKIQLENCELILLKNRQHPIKNIVYI